ncbi:hypothetical protein EVAR_72762_1 [Eumeta japonica]|uniref:Uncharacterized protein n=1 Tax=Eumeta variegata TaxID=151549 RepID=A0A4C1SVK4_EUMVA|nr:hypothetical protein EVAR_72762_1 [Eumeta japonica]
MPTTTQHNPTATATFVQQNATIQVQQPHHQQVSTPQQITLHTLQQHQQNQQQQQPTHHVVNNSVGIVLETTAPSSTSSPNAHVSNLRAAAASPPDTTTHSPRSPERPPSHRSGGSDMVQCVSSSEPDGGTVSPLSTDSRQSPSTTVCEKGNCALKLTISK